jgi:hypothetical protein
LRTHRRGIVAALVTGLIVTAPLVALATPAAAAAPTVVINEVESNGGTPGDWIELKNTGATSVDVSGYILRDNDDADIFTIPAGTVIAADGYYAADVAAAFGLGGADDARLFLPDGTTLLDSYTWTAHAATTYGRCPDGTGAFTTTGSSTKGAANDCGLPTTPPPTPTPTPSVKINEVESNGGTPGDWVELVNTGSSAVDLTGWSMLDNDDTHTAVPLPPGSTIAPGGYFVVEESTLGFGLGASDQARLFDASHTLVDSSSWTQHASTTYGRCPNGSGAFTTMTSSTKGAANDCSVPVKINEVESNGGTPGDWIELINNGSSTVDLSGYILRDNDDTHTFTLPEGTTVAAGGYLAEDVEAAFGLGSADSARLFAPDGTTLIDTYSWTAHAATTYGRCPNGTGAFETTTAPTKGAPNACAGTVTTSPWPGGANITTADDANVLGGNMSGLVYQASGTSSPGVLWAVKNGPGTLFRLLWNGTVWTPDAANGWASGKALHYPDGTGDPDSEGVTVTAAGPDAGVYVSTERNNAANGVSRPEILRFDPTQSGTSLNATGEWNLTADLPAVAPNSGLEAVTWIPDSYLTRNGFADQTTGAAYDPAAHPGHGSGLFFVGLEANGSIYAYALNQVSGTYTRVATISSGMPGVMDLQFDPETQSLWAVCDDTCNGQTETLTVAKTGPDAGRFTVANAYARPSGMPNLNNEGFVVAPQAECVNGLKPVFWADDTNDNGHALRAGTIHCTVVSGPGGGQPGSATVSLGLGTIAAGSALHLTASGFTAGETVEVWLHSTPVKLAAVTTSGSGSVNLTVTIPASTTPGAHSLVVNGVTSGVTGSAALTVTAAGAADPAVTDPAATGTAALAATGSSVTIPLTVALLLAVLGVALLVFRMRRPSRP